LRVRTTIGGVAHIKDGRLVGDPGDIMITCLGGPVDGHEYPVGVGVTLVSPNWDGTYLLGMGHWHWCPHVTSGSI